MDDGFEVVVRFECVSKIRYDSDRHTTEHKSKFALGMLQGRPCIQLWEKAANFPKHLKFSAKNLLPLATPRVHEGRLTIIFRELSWAMLVLSEVKDVPALKRCCDVLENIAKGTFGFVAETPPKSGRGSLQSPGSGRGLSVSPNSARKPPLRLSKASTPVLSRGAAMIAASEKVVAQMSPSSNTASSFYKSTPPSALSQESFHPPKQYHHVKSSAKRALVLSNTQNATTVNREEEDEDFQPAKQLLQAPVSQATRPPLSDLPRYQTPSYQALAKSESREEFEGFANLGNTCYMNAVLQSLLALDPFAEDLLNFVVAKRVPNLSLYRLMFLLLKCKRSKDTYEAQRVLLRKIKGAISERAVKFGSSMQQDAHELLGQCLDQLKEEVARIDLQSAEGKSPEEILSPVVRNFECQMLKSITCKSCGKSTSKSELIYDFALQLPKSVQVRANDQAHLQQLFNLYFSSEDVEYSCTECDGRSASLSHKLGRLPRVLILHLKRYGYNTHLSKNSKRVDNIRIPRFIDVGELCADEVEPPQEFKGPWPRDRSALSVLASSGDKENVSTDTFVTAAALISRQQQAVAMAPPPPPTLTPPASRPESQDAMPSSAPIPLQAVRSILLAAENDETQPLSSSPPGLSDSAPPCSFLDHKSDVKLPRATTSEEEEEEGGEVVPTTTTTVLGKRRSNESTNESAPSVAAGGSGRKVMKMDSSAGGREQEQRNKIIAEFSAVFSPEVSKEFEADTEVITIDDDPPNSSSHTKNLPPSTSSSLCTSTATSNSLCPSTTTNNSLTKAPSDQTPLTPPEEPTESLPPPPPPPPVLLVTPSPSVSGGTEGVPSEETASREEVRSSEMDEDLDLKRAIEASLETQYASLIEMSEEEQFKLALQLSIADSGPEEVALPLSPSPRVTETPTPEKNPREAYRLVSIVSHIGRGSGGGHYISDVYSVSERTWKTCNDSQISEIREEDVRQRRQTTGYIFFYMHTSVLQSVSHHSKSQP